MQPFRMVRLRSAQIWQRFFHNCRGVGAGIKGYPLGVWSLGDVKVKFGEDVFMEDGDVSG